MDILETIISHKREEVNIRKAGRADSILAQSPFIKNRPLSMRQSLEREGSSGIIAEFKRLSPSKGPINLEADVAQVTTGYAEAGASALSVLTDFHFFGGSADDLTRARTGNFNMPILRKDFIVDEFQILEARAMGADVILLIAECLDKWTVAALAKRAKDLGMEVLLELHDESQLDKICDGIDMVGVNNRNLKDFSVNVETSLRLAELLPAGLLKVSESGISDPETLLMLRNAGYKGFLIGESFMKTADPGAACAQFINKIAGRRENPANFTAISNQKGTT